MTTAADVASWAFAAITSPSPEARAEAIKALADAARAGIEFEAALRAELKRNGGQVRVVKEGA